MKNTLTQKQYTKLLSDIANLKQTATTQSNQQLIQTYWQIGKRINQEQLSQNANYHNSIIRNLSKDLTMDQSGLSRCVTLFDLYKTPPKNKILSWSHYKSLITIKDKTLRDQLEKQAIQEQLGKNQLISIIKQTTQTKDPKQKTILKRPTEPTYLYKAKIIDVIDGDTLNLYIDLGFQIHKEQRIRLANLDCPELNTPEGKKSHQFVQNKLAKVSFIMIQTRKADIYGRYIAHIFYDPSNKKTDAEIFENGIYLNEEILQASLAVEL
ncbi:MAG: DUF1016 N-terminal domain-containing protein [Pseudomonadota bacterium]